jgi:RHS repeat-associated protein
VVNGAVMTSILARTSSGGTTGWYLTDNLGSVRDIVSTSGSELDHIVYDSFGNIVTETDAANGDRFKFAEMQYDATIGQYFDNARWYESSAGRFLTQDPIGFAAGDSDLYRYTGNSPINACDRSGDDDAADRQLLLKTLNASLGIMQNYTAQMSADQLKAFKQAERVVKAQLVIFSTAAEGMVAESQNTNLGFKFNINLLPTLNSPTAAQEMAIRLMHEGTHRTQKGGTLLEQEMQCFQNQIWLYEQMAEKEGYYNKEQAMLSCLNECMELEPYIKKRYNIK